MLRLTLGLMLSLKLTLGLMFQNVHSHLIVCAHSKEKRDKNEKCEERFVRRRNNTYICGPKVNEFIIHES